MGDAAIELVPCTMGMRRFWTSRGLVVAFIIIGKVDIMIIVGSRARMATRVS